MGSAARKPAFCAPSCEVTSVGAVGADTTHHSAVRRCAEAFTQTAADRFAPSDRAIAEQVFGVSPGIVHCFGQSRRLVIGEGEPPKGSTEGCPPVSPARSRFPHGPEAWSRQSTESRMW